MDCYRKLYTSNFLQATRLGLVSRGMTTERGSPRGCAFSLTPRPFTFSTPLQSRNSHGQRRVAWKHGHGGKNTSSLSFLGNDVKDHIPTKHQTNGLHRAPTSSPASSQTPA